MVQLDDLSTWLISQLITKPQLIFVLFQYSMLFQDLEGTAFGIVYSNNINVKPFTFVMKLPDTSSKIPNDQFGVTSAPSQMLKTHFLS